MEHLAGPGVASAGLRTRARGLGGWPRGTRSAALGLGAILLPGLVSGGPPLSAALVFLFLFVWVWLPGATFASWLEPEEDELTAAALGLVLGSVLLAFLVFACRASGLFAALVAWPLAGVAFAALRGRRPALIARAAPGATTVVAAGAGLFLVVLVVLLLRVHTGQAGPDVMFHGGNASELTRSGPLLDPRIASRPLNYHLLSHTLPAAVRVVTGVTIAELFQFWIMGFHPLLLVLLVFVLARELAGSAWAGWIAALVLLLHQDLVYGLAGGEREAGFLSHLDVGLFRSPPTCAGLGLLAALTLILLRWCDAARRVDARRVLQLALVAAAASLAKGSVMPAAIAGALFAGLVASLRARRWDRRWLAAFLVLTCAALPATLYLSLGPGAYAGAMFRVVPLASAAGSGVGTWLLEHAPWPASAPLFLRELVVALLWLPGFLGLGGIGALAWLLAGRPSLHGLGPWILGVSGAGLGAALLLLAHGVSQLFFAYDAQVLLALPAGVGIVALVRRRRALASVLALVALPFVAAGCAGIVRFMGLRSERPLASFTYFREGAEWLREESDPGALLVGPEKGLKLTFFAERRIALADDRYSPEGHASRWIREGGRWRLGEATEDPFAELGEACRQLHDRADRAALARLRALTAHTGEVYVVHDDVKYGKDENGMAIGQLTPAPALDASPLFELRFRNQAIAIYRALE